MNIFTTQMKSEQQLQMYAKNKINNCITTFSFLTALAQSFVCQGVAATWIRKIFIDLLCLHNVLAYIYWCNLACILAYEDVNSDLIHQQIWWYNTVVYTLT